LARLLACGFPFFLPGFQILLHGLQIAFGLRGNRALLGRQVLIRLRRLTFLLIAHTKLKYQSAAMFRILFI